MWPTPIWDILNTTSLKNEDENELLCELCRLAIYWWEKEWDWKKHFIDDELIEMILQFFWAFNPKEKKKNRYRVPLILYLLYSQQGVSNTFRTDASIHTPARMETHYRYSFYSWIVTFSSNKKIILKHARMQIRMQINCNDGLVLLNFQFKSKETENWYWVPWLPSFHPFLNSIL